MISATLVVCDGAAFVTGLGHRNKPLEMGLGMLNVYLLGLKGHVGRMGGAQFTQQKLAVDNIAA